MVVEKIPVKVNFNQIVFFSFFCASLGDSGGPIHQWINNHWIQVGIVSFGQDCGLAENPGVYTKLSAYYSWFESVSNETGLIIYEPPIFSTVQSNETNFISMTLLLVIYLLTA